jgi:hypothetical protein
MFAEFLIMPPVLIPVLLAAAAAIIAVLTKLFGGRTPVPAPVRTSGPARPR